VLALVALFLSGSIPTTPVGAEAVTPVATGEQDGP
jgi:hypothetical protein